MLGLGAAVGGWLVAGDLVAACSRQVVGPADVRIGFVSADAQGLVARADMERNCALLAIEELNASGGLAGRTVKMVEASGKSSAERVSQLLGQQPVDVVVGTLADADRGALASRLARSGGLLIDAALQAAPPCGRSLLATGLVPRQQVEPMVAWVLANVGHRVEVLASGDAWSQSAAEAVRSALSRHGQTPVAMRTVRDNASLDTAVADARQLNPDVLWSLLEGSDATRLAEQMGNQALHALVVASRWDELDAAANPGLLTGALTTQSWLMSLDTVESRGYVARYQRRFGAGRALTATGEAISTAIQLFAAAARRAGSVAPGQVAHALTDVQVQSARGTVRVDPASHVAVGDVYVGQVTNGGTIRVHDRLGRPSPSAASCPSRHR